MSLFQSFVFYHVIFASILWLLWLGSRNRTLANLGVLILILVSIFRFDIGNDYENYMLIIEDSKRLFQSCDSMWNTLFVNSTYFGIEPIFELLIWIFHVLDNTYLYVIGLYSLLFILIIYKVLEENGELFWGMFIVFALPILFTSYDQIRQAVSIAIFIYAIKYIEKGDFKHYCYCMLLASLFHFSALLITPIYIIRKIKPRIKFYCLVVLIMYIGLLFDFWSQFRLLLFNSIGLYSHYAESDRQLGAMEYGSGLGILFLMLFYSFLMVKMAHRKPVYSNLLFCGLVLLLFSTGNLNIDRMSNYFCWVSVLAFPAFIKYERRRLIILCSVLLLMVYFERNLVGGVRGCIPYDSVFSENFENKRLRIRWYNFD